MKRVSLGWRSDWMHSSSLYALLAAEHGAQLAEAEETIETVPPARKEVGPLETKVGYPMLLLPRHSSDTSGRPVEVAPSFYRGDRYEFVAQLRAQVPLARGGQVATSIRAVRRRSA